jgi:5-methylcytosine-specific restriction protein B
VLDEINRTDLSAMLGEAFSLLERDQRGQERMLPGFDADQEPDVLVIPPDLYVIGTMNEIDQSVESLDFALRRRFLWRPCPFERDTLLHIIASRWSADIGRFAYEDAGEQLDRFADRAEVLNRAIAESPELGGQYEIGHTYFADITFFMGAWVRSRANKPANGSWLWTPRAGNVQPPLEGLWERSLGPLLEQYLAGSDIRKDELARLRGILLAA